MRAPCRASTGACIADRAAGDSPTPEVPKAQANAVATRPRAERTPSERRAEHHGNRRGHDQRSRHPSQGWLSPHRERWCRARRSAEATPLRPPDCRQRRTERHRGVRVHRRVARQERLVHAMTPGRRRGRRMPSLTRLSGHRDPDGVTYGIRPVRHNTRLEAAYTTSKPTTSRRAHRHADVADDHRRAPVELARRTCALPPDLGIGPCTEGALKSMAPTPSVASESVVHDHDQVARCWCGVCRADRVVHALRR